MRGDAFSKKGLFAASSGVIKILIDQG